MSVYGSRIPDLLSAGPLTGEELMMLVQQGVSRKVDVASIKATDTGDIADGAVTTPKLADGAVTDEKIASGIDATKIGSGDVDNSEFSYLNGTTSSIQTQLNAKEPTITGAATTIASSNLTANRAVISNGSGKIAVSAVTSTQLGYVSGVTSSIQTQLNAKEPTITGAATTIASADLTIDRAVISNGSGKIAISPTTSTELGYVSGVTSSIQTQLNAKEPTINLTANRAVASDGSGALTASSATSTELGYVSGVTSSIQTQLNNKQPLDSTLTALAAYNTNGLLTQTSSDTFAGRTITGTANNIEVTNGNGVSGNPTITLPNSLTFTGKTISGGTFNGPAININSDSLLIRDSVDQTKQLDFDLSALATSTTRTIIMPDSDVDLGDVASALTSSDIGTTVQAYDVDLAAISALTSSANKIIQYTGAGAATLADFIDGTWTPSISFTTPGDLSVSYSTQFGRYMRIGSWVLIYYDIITSAFTHSTASGNFQLTGLPIAVSGAINGYPTTTHYSGFSLGAGYSKITGLIASSTNMTFNRCGSGVAQTNITPSQVPSGGSVVLIGVGIYRV